MRNKLIATVVLAYAGLMPGAGTSTNFVVDRKLALTVTEQDAGTTVNVSPGQTATVLKYLVTNTGNDTQDVLFQALQRINGVTGGGTGTDNFNSNNTKVFVDSNGNGTYDSGTDTAVFADELAPDASKTVFVVSDIPLSQIDSDAAKISLVAQVAAGGAAGTQGTAITADSNGHRFCADGQRNRRRFAGVCAGAAGRKYRGLQFQQ